MDQDRDYLIQLMAERKAQIAPFLRYQTWLLQHAGVEVGQTYQTEEMGAHALAIPVYDATLMSFIREMQKSSLMDRNYRYVYTRHHITSHDAERTLIYNATYKEWDMLRGILSFYVLGGRTKSVLWNEAVTEQIFYLVLSKMQQIVEYYNKSEDLQ